eukprot:6788682-Pyramimonas_sp.AAC.1
MAEMVGRANLFSCRSWLLITALAWALLPMALQAMNRFSQPPHGAKSKHATFSTRIMDSLANTHLIKGPTWPAGVWWDSKKQKDWM